MKKDQITELWIRMSSAVSDRTRHDRGATLVEYALLIGIIAVGCIAAVSLFAGETTESLSRTASSVGNA